MAQSKKAESNSELVSKGHPCDQPSCLSSDAVALYSDGHTHCFSCGHTVQAAGHVAPPHEEAIPEAFPQGSIKAIAGRKLTQATCREWDYQVRQTSAGEIEHLAFYRDEHGHVVGCKIRNVGTDGTAKEFGWVGSAKGNLYGRHKWSAGGRILTICEGEIDTLTVSQCYAHKYPVVGVPNGAHEAAKAVAKNLDWINTFQKVVICLDMDHQGREAAIECAKLLPPGKAFIVRLPGTFKDPNEMLQAGEGEAITRAIWNAEAYRPDGIVDARTLTGQALDPPEHGTPWPWKFMTDWTYGRRGGEVYVIGAGTGIGKTDFVQEVIASTLTGTSKDAHAEYPPEGFGIFAYESGPVQMKIAIAGKIYGKRFHIPPDPEFPEWTHEDLRDAMEKMDGFIWNGGGRLFINDAKGAADWESVKERARYLRHAEGITNFMVDPLSALVAGEEDERKMLDAMILEAANLAEELGSKFYITSHLTRPKEGPSHEEGGHVRLSQFRGSNGIAMFADFVFGMERNQQAEDATERTEARIRVLKDRFTNNSIGKVGSIVYDQITGSYDVPLTKFIGDV